MKAFCVASVLLLALLCMACECANVDYLTNYDGQVFVRLRQSPPPPPASGIPRSYYKVLSDNEHPLTTLMRESDLIVEATCVGLVVSNGGWPYVVNGEVVSFLCAAQIKRILGSVWDGPELSKHLAVWPSYTSERVVSNVVFVVFHRIMRELRERDAILGMNGDYLLFLADYPMTEAQEQMGVPSACLFKTVKRSQGAVLLTPPEKLSGVSKPEYVEMYANSTTLLSNLFNTANSVVIVDAVSAMAKGMRASGSTPAASGAAEVHKGLSILGLGANGNVCTLTNLARFKMSDAELK